MDKLVTIRLHGDLGNKIGKKYRLAVKSTGEAIHAINCLTNNRLYKYLYEKDKDGVAYEIIINNKKFECNSDNSENLPSQIISELTIPNPHLQEIDVVPVIQGAEDVGLLILGALLITLGAIFFETPFGVPLIVIGVGLLVGGVMLMLAKPPDFDDFRQGKRNYLFDGPENIAGEGGPVPILYGRLIVGSQVIAGYYDTSVQAVEKEQDYLIPFEIGSNGQIISPSLWQKGVTSTEKAIVMDLVSEGPIDGPVEVEYQFQGTPGNIGFDTVTRVPNKSKFTASEIFLRSVLYNEVPILSAEGDANFQAVVVRKALGNPDGYIFDKNGSEVRVTRQIGDRLYYSSAEENAKIYRIYNQFLKRIDVGIKFGALYKSGDSGPTKAEAIDFHIYYRPIYKLAGDSYSQSTSTSATFPLQSDVPYQNVHLRIGGKVVGGPMIWVKAIDISKVAVKEDLVGWEVKIIRNTIEISGSAASPTFVDSITEVYQDQLSFPNTAHFYNEFKADYFSQIPKRAYDLRGIKVKIPSNYEPIQKKYTPINIDDTTQEWDGTFNDNVLWTDNPAWCFYDLCTNPRYGLGRWLNPVQKVGSTWERSTFIDKWTLYMIGKYCDTMVHNGYGSVEPRFTSNVYIVSREQAWKVLNDFSSIFNAIVYYGYGSVNVVQDSPKSPVTQFTNANVEEGNFIYSSSSRKNRHTVALIRYSDPKNFFRPATEWVEDIPGIQKYGYREMDLTAFGCTSRGQAVRLGRWALLTENTETETIGFTAGLEASYLKPGDIFKVFDANKKLSNYAGRINSFDGSYDPTKTKVYLDRELNLNDFDANKTYMFSLVTPSYTYNTQLINNSIAFFAPRDVEKINQPQIQKRKFTKADILTEDGKTNAVVLDPVLNSTDYSIIPNQVWLIEPEPSDTSLDIVTGFTSMDFDYYRCIRVEEKDTLKYDIAGLQYVSGKFNLIDEGFNFERSIDQYGAVPVPPVGLSVSNSPGSPRYKVSYSFVAPTTSGVTSYWVYASKTMFGTGVPDNQYLVDTVPLDRRDGCFYPTTTGNYYLRIYSYNNDAKILSTSYVSGVTRVEEATNPIESVSISNLQVTSYTGSYSGDVPIIETYDLNPIFTWQVGLLGATDDLGALSYRLTIRQPSSGLIPSSRIYYEATGIRNSGILEYTFDFERNKNLYGGPYRNFSVVVEAYSEGYNQGLTSAGNMFRPYRDEVGWVSHPYGYRHILYMIPPPSGVTLTSGSFITGDYVTTGYIDPLGGIMLKFTSGNLPSGTVGCYIYSDTGYYSGEFAKTGNAIKRTEVEFNSSNHINKTVYAPYAFEDFRIKSGWIAFSPYGEFDLGYKRKNPSFYTGLDISNVVPITRFGGVSDLYITSQIHFEDFARGENAGSLKISGSGTNYDFLWIDSGGNGWILSSYTGN